MLHEYIYMTMTRFMTMTMTKNDNDKDNDVIVKILLSFQRISFAEFTALPPGQVDPEEEELDRQYMAE